MEPQLSLTDACDRTRKTPIFGLNTVQACFYYNLHTLESHFHKA